MLQRREFRYEFSWIRLREIGINLAHDSQVNTRVLEDDEYVIRKLKEHMPEMLRIKGYDVNMQPILSLDYFKEYCNAVFDRANHPPKPSGHYLFNEQGYRVLVDEQGTPVKPGGVRDRGIDCFGKMFVKSYYRL
jgi:hypothetical protein